MDFGIDTALDVNSSGIPRREKVGYGPALRPVLIEWVEREVQNPDIDQCVFCELPERDADREIRIVAGSEHAYVLLNNYPYNLRHVMVIPHLHTGSFENLPEEVLATHARLKARTFEAMSAAFAPDGFNTGLNLGRGAEFHLDS